MIVKLVRLVPGCWWHAMDAINSALEASPWGVYGYGFDAYTRSQLNSVSALASYWIDFTSQTLSFEEAHPDRCLRVCYEELVTDPERVAAEVFDFIGVAPVPGINRYALLDQERSDILAGRVPRKWLLGRRESRVFALSEAIVDR